VEFNISVTNQQSDVTIKILKSVGTFEKPKMEVIESFGIGTAEKKTKTVTFDYKPIALTARALEDLNGDAKCTAGEYWDEKLVTIDYIGQKATTLVLLNLAEKDCPNDG